VRFKVRKVNYWVILLIGVLVVSVPLALMLPKLIAVIAGVPIGSVWGHLCATTLRTK